VERRANWAAAEVEATAEGLVLKVPLEGEAGPAWDYAFHRAVEARRHELWGRHWGHVRQRPNEVWVEQVTEGYEWPLQEFLDACIRKAHERVRQEGADRWEDEEALESRRTEASHGHEPSGRDQVAIAQRLTERFRAGGQR
jgi:ABC-type phosphonate transport system ATPase subunit